ncbi:MFS transporter [Paraburkholderia tropica]|uniref:MFS transporter n=1 Tax=Paraburkholderia tropica TaxID=92647 RepID=UPI002AB018AA|nr:MFS transporter [Paraburkholderia tropica]
MTSQSPSKAAALTLLCVACLTIMVGCVIVPGLPSVAKHLGVSEYASSLVTIPSLGVVIFGPIAGRIIDRTGLRRSLCIGLFLYGLLGAYGMFLHGTYVVFADRLLLGGATALVMSAGTGMISALYEGHARLTMIARQGMSIELGGVIFLSIGGMLAAQGWQYPFLLYLIAWLLLAMVIALVPSVDAVEPEADDQAMTPVSAELKLVYLAAAGSMILFFTGIIALPLALATIGFNETLNGYFLSFISLVAVGAAFMMPRIASRIGEHRTLTLAFIFYGVAHAVFAMAASTPIFTIGGIAMGFGFGLSVPLVNHMTVEQSHVKQRGRNLAYLSMAIFLGQFLSSFMNIASSDIHRVFIAALILACCALFVVTIAHSRLRASTTHHS